MDENRKGENPTPLGRSISLRFFCISLFCSTFIIIIIIFCQTINFVRLATQHFSVRYTPQQDRIAERLNKTLLEKVCCMLSQVKLPKRFWVEALRYACHVLNRLPSTTLEGRTPLEVWYGESARKYDKLRVFGCNAYFHVKENKLDPQAKKAVFMGFNSGVKGFRLW